MRAIHTPDAIVESLRKKAKKLQRNGAGKHTELLDRVARSAGYDHWHHVTLCNNEFQRKAVTGRPRDVFTYAQIAAKTEEVRQIYERRNLPLHPLSVLSQYFDRAVFLAKAFDEGSTSGSIHDILAMTHANRISDAILGVADEALAQELLLRIGKKDMDLDLRVPSQGKDSLWELELLSFLRRNGAKAWLHEPDIMVSLDGIDYPIACKKVNSEANVIDQVRKACKQLANFGARGIVALNIDALVPESSILRGPTDQATAGVLRKLTEEFLDRNIMKFQEAIAGEKCDAMIFSVTSPADISHAKPRFNLQNETTFWSVADRNPDGKARLTHLGKILKAPPAIRRSQ